MRLALWMVLVTILMQFGHAIYRFSTDVPQAKQAGLQEIEKVVGSIRPALSEALFQYNESVSAEVLKTFDAYPSVLGVWLLDEEEELVHKWSRDNTATQSPWLTRQWTLNYQSKDIGFVRISLSDQYMIMQARENILSHVGFSSLMGGVTLLLLYWVVQRQVAKPIIELSNIVKDINTTELAPQDVVMLDDVHYEAEVETLKRSVQAILAQLAENLADKKHTMSLLQTFNQDLEARVISRTQQLKIAKDKAEVASRSKTDFLNNMTHELRTPLNSIMGFSNLLMSQDLPEKWQKMVDNIHCSGTQLLTLISDIIDFVDLDDGQLNVQLFSLYDVISATTHLYKEVAKQKSLTIDMNVDNELIMYGDPKRLGIALRHILDNAMKFTEQGGVMIECNQSKNDVIGISIKDTGIGIDLAKISDLRESFVQADNGLNRTKEGVGLGLAIVERICKKWGGEITFNNILPQGTQVLLRLPNLKS
jgi:signal transduction histidine kinase